MLFKIILDEYEDIFIKELKTLLLIIVFLN